MAVRTAILSSNWSFAGTWDTGEPVSGDTAVIKNGLTVTQDRTAGLPAGALDVELGDATTFGILHLQDQSVLALDDAAAARIIFKHASSRLLDSNVGLQGRATIRSATTPGIPANRWRFEVSGTFLPGVRTTRTTMYGAKYGLHGVSIGLTPLQLTLADLGSDPLPVVIVRHRPIGRRKGLTYWNGSGEESYRVMVLFSLDTDPLLFQTLATLAARNESYLFVGDVLQREVFIQPSGPYHSPELRQDWIELRMVEALA